MFKEKKYSYTYGELTKNGIKTIIDYVRQTINYDNLSKYTFYDLSSKPKNPHNLTHNDLIKM